MKRNVEFEATLQNAVELLYMKSPDEWTMSEVEFDRAADWYGWEGTFPGLEDPANRLEVISWLRANGWKVEPA